MIRLRNHILAVLTLVLVAGACAAHSSTPAAAARSMNVLVLTGEDNAHNWDANSSLIIQNWEQWGITNVERQAMRTSEEWLQWRGNYADYDAVVLMYYTADAPAQPIEALASYVAGGGALVVVHSALAGLSGHQAFDQMIGVGWRGANYGSSLAFDEAGEPIRRAPGEGRGAAHPPLMDFPVQTRVAAHPVMRGLPATWMQANDELYFNLRGPIGEMEVLATARVPNGEHAPMIWTKRHGQGRVFVTALGHHEPSIRSLGFMTTLVRGLEWAVTGEVTRPVPRNFPGATAPVLAAPEFE
jgi:uncharacterized protein